MKTIFRQDCNDKLQPGTTANPNLSPPFLMFASTIAFIPVLKTRTLPAHGLSTRYSFCLEYSTPKHCPHSLPQVCLVLTLNMVYLK